MATNKTIKLTIDGREVECPAGSTVLQAALDNGIFIPHYCYHPALSLAGNCRMCMVEIVPKLRPGQKPPPKKPAVACATIVAEGMEILTDTELVLEARRGVLELLLINHPLDCPICDQAGECDLQEYSFKHGQCESRFREDKHTKHAKDMGPLVRLYGNRCINCTRCVRFSQEIAGTGHIAQVNRGGRTVVDIFPGHEFDHPLSGNIVDLCPVGALVSRDFLHRARVWQLDATPGVCPHCATGCTIEVHTHDETIARLKPYPNPEVNGYWMCDRGRQGFGFVHSAERLGHFHHTVDGERRHTSFQRAVSQLGVRMSEAGDKGYVVASYWMSNEDLQLLHALVPAERVAFIGRPAEEEQRFFPKWGDSERNPSLPGQHERGKLYDDGATFAIAADKNPNRAGAVAIFGEEACSGARLEQVLDKAAKGEVEALWVISGMPEFEPPEALLAAVKAVSFVCVADVAAGPLCDGAEMLMPIAAFTEHEGTYTNGRGTTQRFDVARPAFGHARPLLEVLYSLGKSLDKEVPGFTAARVFAELAAKVELFSGLSWDGLRVKLAKRWSPHSSAHGAVTAGERPVLHPVLPVAAGDGDR